MRGGRVVDRAPAPERTPEQLVRAMVGREKNSVPLKRRRWVKRRACPAGPRNVGNGGRNIGT